jgi:hypothetical protein
MLKICKLPPRWAEREEPDYFHPSIAELVDGSWLMTLQRKLPFDDIYGAPEFSLSRDRGLDWSIPKPLSGMEYREVAPGIIRNVADIRTFSSPDRREALAIGVTSYYYRDGKQRLPAGEHTELTTKQPMYAFFRPESGWTSAQLLEAACFDNGIAWRAACAELIWFPNGSIILPVYFSDGDRFSVRTLRLERLGDALRAVEWGPVLTHNAGRGFIEPSAVFFEGRHFLTIRAEDGHGYWCESADGLQWTTPVAWQFDDGAVFETGTTQQHWLKIGKKLCLVYTRRLEDNEHVFRWRSPLLIAEFNPATGKLRHATETVVFPYRERNGLYNRMGNFHAAELVDGSGVVSVGAAYIAVKGDTITENFTEICVAEIT